MTTSTRAKLKQDTVKQESVLPTDAELTEEGLKFVYNKIQQLPSFEGASTDYRNAQRVAYLGDADRLAIPEYHLLQGRSRHLSRNNAIVTSAENKYVVKLGAIRLLWKKKDGSPHDLMQELWDEFYANPNLDGFGNGDTMQSTWNHDRMQSGEAIGRMVIVSDTTNRVPLKIQSIESEYLDINYMGQDNIETILPVGTTRYGITFDDNNAPQYYNFWPNNRFGIQPMMNFDWRHVVVDSRDILHMFERTRSNQWRGIPVVAALLSNIYELTDLREATVNKQQAAAAIAWIVEQVDTYNINAVGSVKTAGKKSSEDKEKKIVFQANGGNVQYTNPGEKFQLVQSSDIGSNLIGLVKYELQSIASGYDIPYYMLSGDTSGLDFSSLRGILIAFRNRLEYIHHFVCIPNGMGKLAARFKDIARFSYKVEDAFATYMFPRNYGVDELKDAQADILEIQSGLGTLKRAQEERNLTQEEVEADRVYIQSLGITGLLDVGTSNSGTSGNLTNGNAAANTQTTGN